MLLHCRLLERGATAQLACTESSTSHWGPAFKLCHNATFWLTLRSSDMRFCANPPMQADKGSLLQTNLGGFGPGTTGGSTGTAAAGGALGTAGSVGAPVKIKLKVGGKKEKKVSCRWRAGALAGSCCSACAGCSGAAMAGPSRLLLLISLHMCGCCCPTPVCSGGARARSQWVDCGYQPKSSVQLYTSFILHCVPINLNWFCTTACHSPALLSHAAPSPSLNLLRNNANTIQFSRESTDQHQALAGDSGDIGGQRRRLGCCRRQRCAANRLGAATTTLASAAPSERDPSTMRLPLLLLALGLGPWPPATGSQPRASVSDELSPTEDAATLAALDEASLGPLWVRVQAAARTAAAARAAASGAAIDSTNLLQPADVAAQRELLAFLRQYNATVMFEPGLDCLTCPRLATATERRAAGDTILRLPSRLLPALSIAQAREGEAGVSLFQRVCCLCCVKKGCRGSGSCAPAGDPSAAQHVAASAPTCVQPFSYFLCARPHVVPQAFAEQLLRSSDLSASFFEHRCRRRVPADCALWGGCTSHPLHARSCLLLLPIPAGTSNFWLCRCRLCRCAELHLRRPPCCSFKGWLLALWLRAQPTHRRGVAFSFQVWLGGCGWGDTPSSVTAGAVEPLATAAQPKASRRVVSVPARLPLRLSRDNSFWRPSCRRTTVRTALALACFCADPGRQAHSRV